jgi:hypothetical protein
MDDEAPIRQWPFPLDEAADLVLSTMDSETKDAVAKTPRNEMIRFHMNIGMWIRNNFGMWKACKGLDADAEWMPVLEAVWDKLHLDDSKEFIPPEMH